MVGAMASQHPDSKAGPEATPFIKYHTSGLTSGHSGRYLKVVLPFTPERYSSGMSKAGSVAGS